jgi:glycosyltransferase involved in cell wall biosynthesis
MRILYTGAFRFPDKDAASQRVLNIGKIFRKVGYDVTFFGWEKKERPEDLLNTGKYCYKGFEYSSQFELDREIKNPLLKLKSFIFRGSTTIRNIKNYIKQNEIDCIIAYNSNSYFLYQLFRLTKKNNIKLVCDCTEWYEGDHLPGGKYGLANFDNNFRIKIIYPLLKNVIVISSFLENYLNKKGCNTIKIPPLVDLSESRWNLNNEDNLTDFGNDKLKIIYAGNPGRKDLLQPFFDALNIINKTNIRMEFMIVGVKKETIRMNYFSEMKDLPLYINCVGRVSLEEVSFFYGKADFSILLRENKRYANAGFPTKLVESLTFGVPIITNNTSDIMEFIKDGINGVVLPENSVKSIVECFNKLLNITEDNLLKMSEKSRQCSEKSFAYEEHIKAVMNYYNKLN